MFIIGRGYPHPLALINSPVTCDQFIILTTSFWIHCIQKFYFFFLFLSYCFSLDKALNSLGYKFGYALLKPQLPNPINIVMVYAQRVSIKSVVILKKEINNDFIILR